MVTFYFLTPKRPVDFKREIRPICLPVNQQDQYVGKGGVITGWGMNKQVIECQTLNIVNIVCSFA